MCCCVVKYILFTFNSLFLLCGGLLLGVGLWLVIDRTSIPGMLKFLEVVDQQTADSARDTLNTNTVQTVGYILIAAGAIMMIVSFLGCCGACLNSKWLLTMYSVCLIAVLSLEIGAGVYAVVARTKFQDSSRSLMLRSLHELYGVNGDQGAATVSWNVIMKDFQCCGVGDFNDFQESRWINEHRPMIFPDACCKRPNTGRDCQTRPEQYSNYKTGCFDKVWAWLQTNVTIILGVALAVGIMQVVGIILSFYLCCSVVPLK